MSQSLQADCVLESNSEKKIWASVRRGKKEPDKIA